VAKDVPNARIDTCAIRTVDPSISLSRRYEDTCGGEIRHVLAKQVLLSWKRVRVRVVMVTKLLLETFRCVGRSRDTVEERTVTADHFCLDPPIREIR